MLPSLLYMTKTPKTKLVSAILQTAVTFVNSKGFCYVKRDFRSPLKNTIAIYTFDWLYFIRCLTYFFFVDHYLSLWRVSDTVMLNASSRITSLLIHLSLETSAIKTGKPILMELIYLVKPVIIFLLLTTLLALLTFLLQRSLSCSFEIILFPQNVSFKLKGKCFFSLHNFWLFAFCLE